MNNEKLWADMAVRHDEVAVSESVSPPASVREAVIWIAMFLVSAGAPIRWEVRNFRNEFTYLHPVPPDGFIERWKIEVPR